MIYETELDLYIHTQTVTHQQENKTTNKKERGRGGRIGKDDLYGFNYPNWFSEQCKYSDAEKKKMTV